MTTVILVLTIFNTGLILMGFAGAHMIKETLIKCVLDQAIHIDESIEAATEARA